MNKKMWACSLPWIHSFVNNNGEMQVCCTSEETNRNCIADDNGVAWTIERSPSLEQVMNSSLMKQTRFLMMEGLIPELCLRCKLDEENGGVSRRLIELDEKKFDDLLKNTAKDGTLLKVEIKEADYRLGNKCNLHCRMCTSLASIRCVDNGDEISLRFNKLYDWDKSPSLLVDFKNKLMTLEKIHFAGGEPLISPQMSHLLDLTIASGRASKINLSFNTNMTVLDDDILKKWEHFQKIRIFASIDGVGVVNDYIRLGSSWENIHKNLLKLDDFASRFPETEIMLSTTVQAMNVLSIDEIINYLKRFKHIVPIPNLVNLIYPPHLSTRILPSALKREVETKLQKIYEETEGKIPQSYYYLRENLFNVISFMQKDESDLFPSFLKYQKRLDEKNHFKTLDVLPFLRPYYF